MGERSKTNLKLRCVRTHASCTDLLDLQKIGLIFRRSGANLRKIGLIFQNWLSIITGAGQALDMGAYTGADESVETRTSSYAKTHETPKG